MQVRVLQLFVALCAAWFSGLCSAEDADINPSGASVAGWLSGLKAGFEKSYRERVVGVHKAGLEEARKEYAEQLQQALNEASRAGDKQAAAVFLQESERVAEESWQMPPDDQDTSMEAVRRARRIYRDRASELNRGWDEASRKLVAEFESALLQGARQLTAKNLDGEVRRVLESRRELVSVWLPRMWEVHRGERSPVHDGGDGGGRGGKGPSSDSGGSDGAASRKEVEEAVKWVLQGNGRIQVVRKGKIQKLEKVGDLPGGKVDFWSVELHRRYFGRGLLPGELERLGRFQTLKHLRVWGFSVPPEDWEFLAGLHQLQWVYISNTIFDTRSGRWLGQSPQLSALELTSCEGLSAEFFRGLAAGVPGLQVLRISGSKIQDADGCELARFERLESLDVDYTGLTSAVLPAWAGFRHLKKLQLFDGPWPREGLEALSRSPIESFGFLNVDDPECPSQVALVGELFPKLKALKFKGKEFGANQAQAVLEACKNLEELDVQSALPILEAAKILARMPHLQSLTCRAPGMGDPVFQELLASRTLQELDVVGTQVSDQSAEAIRRAGMNGLRKLTVVGTRISKGTAASLERRTKGLEVHVLPTVQEPER